MAGRWQFSSGDVVGGLRIERVLGRGTYGTVYLAQDEVIGREVAVKIVLTTGVQLDPDPHRVLREARLVGKLKSPHIITLYRVQPLGENEGWLFEMEYAEKGSLSDLLGEKGALTAGRAIDFHRQILSALAAAHDQGIVHGDVKPGNVLLNSAGLAQLADFGLARFSGDAALAQSTSGTPVGTPTYMAPEVLLGSAPESASDLWSAGVVFFRMLTGRLPFDARTFHDLFVAVVNGRPATLPPEIPEHVREAALALLARDPADRPPSAREALAMLDAPQVATRPERGSRAAPAAPTLVGRSKELDWITGLLHKAVEGSGSTLIVSGEAGSGKSALVAGIAPLASELGFLAIEASVSGTEGLLRPLLHRLDGAVRKAGIDAIERRIRRSASDLAPTLFRELLDGRVDVNLESRPQIAWAVERILVALAEEHPLLLVLEDVQMADVEDLRLLRELARRLHSDRALLAVCYRTHALDSSASGSAAQVGYHELATIDGVQTLAIPPLEPQAVYRLLERGAEGLRVAPEIARRVEGLAEGNPRLALEMFRHLRESQAIVAEGEDLRPASGWDEVRLPSRFHDLVAVRLTGLGEEDRTLLDVCAIEGRTVDADLLAAVLERPLLGVLRDLQRIFRERHLVETHGDGFRFASSMTPQVIYEELAPALRRALHRQIAGVLAKRRSKEPVDPERLGNHWERAGELEEARPLLLEAAHAAAARQESRRVIDLCARAGLRPGKIDAKTAIEHNEILFKLASMLGTLSRPEEARQVHEAIAQAAEAAGDTALSARCEAAAAWQRYYTDGVKAIDGERLLAIVPTLPEGLQRGDTYYLLGIHARNRGEAEVARTQFESADASYLAAGLQGKHSTVVNGLASLASRAGLYDEARSLYEEARRISASVGRRINAAVSAINASFMSVELGEMEGVAPILEKSILDLRLEGSENSAAHAAVSLAQVHYACGDLSAAEAALADAERRLGPSPYLAALVPLRFEQAHLALVRGEATLARARLAETHEVAARAGNARIAALAHALETLLCTLLRDRRGAATASARLIELLRSSTDASLHVESTFLLVEAVLHGLPAAALEDLPEVSGHRHDGVLRTFMAGALAFAAPDGDPAPIRAAAEGLAKAPLGMRRAVLRLHGEWLAAEAARRSGGSGGSGSEEDALRHAQSGAEGARRLGHVWLEVSLRSLLGKLQSQEENSSRLRSLVRKLAEGVTDPNR